jgi:peptidoglycan/LPS O-acetylase OafA/YrhL
MLINKHRVDIEALRALAAISVVLYHFLPEVFPNGYLGVDIFFVISGYVVTQSLILRKQNNSNTLSFIFSFLLRRINRLLPALLCTLILTYGIALFLLPPHAVMETRMIVISAIAGISNILLMIRETDYFGISSEFLPVLHTWSLGVESQFYILLPFLIVFTNLRRSLFLVGVLSILSFILYFVSSDIVKFFSPVTRFWELAAGVLLALLQQKELFTRNISPKINFVLLFLLLAVLFTNLGDSNTPYLLIMSVVITFFLLSSENVKPSTPMALMGYVGKRSYSIYLWHFPVYSIISWSIGYSYFMTIPMILLTYILADLQFRLIEIKLKQQINALTLGVVTICLAISFVGFVKYTSDRLSKNTLDSFQPAWVEIFNKKIETFEASKNLECHYQSYSFGENEFFQRCLPKTDGKAIFIIGDSHGGTIRRAWLREYPEDSIFGVHANSLPTLMSETGLTPDLMTLLTNAKKNDTVILAFFHGKLNPDERFHSFKKTENVKTNFLYRNLNHFITEAGEKEIQIILVGDNPKLSRPVRMESCVLVMEVFGYDSCKVSRQLATQSRFPQEKLFMKLQIQHKNVTYFDSLPHLCEADECLAFKNDNQLYSDYNHLSHLGILQFLDKLRKLVKKEIDE